MQAGGFQPQAPCSASPSPNLKKSLAYWSALDSIFLTLLRRFGIEMRYGAAVGRSAANPIQPRFSISKREGAQMYAKIFIGLAVSSLLLTAISSTMAQPAPDCANNLARVTENSSQTTPGGPCPGQTRDCNFSIVTTYDYDCMPPGSASGLECLVVAGKVTSRIVPWTCDQSNNCVSLSPIYGYGNGTETHPCSE